VRRTGSPPHLDEGDDLVPFYDEVDLPTKESDVTVQNTPTPVNQIARSELFEVTTPACGVQGTGR